MAQAQQVAANKKSTTDNNLKIFASLERKILVPLTGDASDPEMVYNKLRGAGARVALDRIQSLIDGTVENVRGFEVLTVMGHTNNEPPQQRRRTRDYDPTGELKTIKRGTTYAGLMEMMVKGATKGEMVAYTNNKTEGGVNDVISWKVRDCGYGIRFDKATGKYHLVFPKGVTALKYQD